MRKLILAGLVAESLFGCDAFPERVTLDLTYPQRYSVVVEKLERAKRNGVVKKEDYREYSELLQDLETEPFQTREYVLEKVEEIIKIKYDTHKTNKEIEFWRNINKQQLLPENREII